MARGKGKGSQFERDFSRDLSLWWTRGKRNDLFWRSAMSGGMSTVTGCANQAGDIIAVSAEGSPVTEAICFELKCGYKACQPWDLIDGNNKKPIINDFIDQAKEAAKRAGAMWALVIKRDRKKPTIAFPIWVSDYLSLDYQVTVKTQYHSFMTVRLDEFFEKVDPEKFIQDISS